MHFELLGHVHYMVLLWERHGHPPVVEMDRAAGGLLKQLVRDFITAVTDHRRYWGIDRENATEVRDSTVHYIWTD